MYNKLDLFKIGKKNYEYDNQYTSSCVPIVSRIITSLLFTNLSVTIPKLKINLKLKLIEQLNEPLRVPFNLCVFNFGSYGFSDKIFRISISSFLNFVLCLMYLLTFLTNNDELTNSRLNEISPRLFHLRFSV